MIRLLTLLVLTACSPMTYTHGVPNFAQVGPGVYRSGQISSQEGWDYVKTVAAGRTVYVIKLNYANEGSDDRGSLSGFHVIELPIQPQGDRDLYDNIKDTLTQPDPQTVARIDKLLLGARAGEMWLVHCTHGQDRTGYIIGRYRVLHDHWSKDAAYAEMRAHNFHPELHGIHQAWEDLKP